MADRYSYISLLGPFFIAGFYAQKYVDKNKGKMPLAGSMVAGAIVVLLVIISIKQTSTWKNGVALWEHAIKVCPSSTAFSNRGMIYRDEGNNREALRCYSQAINMDKMATDDLINRANIYLKQQRYRMAINDYSQCLSIEPHDDLALANRGAAYLAIGMIDSARVDLDRAIKINPESGNAYKNRGMLYLITGRYPEAINDYLKQLKIMPDVSGEIWSKIGYSFQQIGNHTKAIEAFTNAITIAENGNFYYLRAISYYQSGNISMARNDAQKAIAMSVPMNPAFMKSLGMK
jgi:tetratricopeptide (TPR) repeat protein